MMLTEKLKRIMIIETLFSLMRPINKRKLAMTIATNKNPPKMNPSPHHPFENPCTEIINNRPNNMGLN